MTMEDRALDPDLWQGSQLAWRFADRMDGWEPSWRRDSQLLKGDLPRVLRMVRLLKGMQEATTYQLHEVDPLLPAQPDAVFWGRVAASGMVDLGFPLPRLSKPVLSPQRTPFMALQLSNKTPRGWNEGVLTRLGANPIDLTLLGDGTLRVTRGTADRHNLTGAALYAHGVRLGWNVVGETHCKFSLICHDPALGNGGPDLAWRDDRIQVCMEVSRSSTTNTLLKAPRWKSVLNRPGLGRMHVLWVDATGGHILTELGNVSARVASERSHVTTVENLMAGEPCVDGWRVPQPGPVTVDTSWWTRTMNDLTEAVGWPTPLPYPPHLLQAPEMAYIQAD